MQFPERDYDNKTNGLRLHCGFDGKSQTGNRFGGIWSLSLDLGGCAEHVRRCATRSVSVAIPVSTPLKAIVDGCQLVLHLRHALADVNHLGFQLGDPGFHVSKVAPAAARFQAFPGQPASSANRTAVPDATRNSMLFPPPEISL